MVLRYLRSWREVLGFPLEDSQLLIHLSQLLVLPVIYLFLCLGLLHHLAEHLLVDLRHWGLHWQLFLKGLFYLRFRLLLHLRLPLLQSYLLVNQLLHVRVLDLLAFQFLLNLVAVVLYLPVLLLPFGQLLSRLLPLLSHRLHLLSVFLHYRLKRCQLWLQDSDLLLVLVVMLLYLLNQVLLQRLPLLDRLFKYSLIIGLVFLDDLL